MKDPGYISEAAWNQEHPYRDADGVDLEMDQRWESADPSGFYYDDSFLPNPAIAPGAAPAVTDCRGTTPLTPAGVDPLAGVSSIHPSEGRAQ